MADTTDSAPSRREVRREKNAARAAENLAAFNIRAAEIQANMLPRQIQRDADIKQALNVFVRYLDYWMPDISRIAQAEKKYKEIEAGLADGEEMPEIDWPITMSTLSKGENAVYKAFEGTEPFRELVRSLDARESVGDFITTIERLAFHMRNIDLARSLTEIERQNNPKLSTRDNFVMKPYVHHATELMDFARGCLLEVLESESLDPTLKAYCKDTFEMVLQRSFEVLKKADVSKSKLERFVDNSKITGKIPQPLVRKVTDDAYKSLQRKYRAFDFEKSPEEIERRRIEKQQRKGRAKVVRAGSAAIRGAKWLADTDLKRGIEPESFVEEAILTGHLRRNMKDISVKEKVITRLRILERQVAGALARPSLRLARFTDRKNEIPTISNIVHFKRGEKVLPWFYGTGGEIDRWWSPIREQLLDRFLDATDLLDGEYSQELLDDLQMLFEDELDAMDLNMFSDPKLYPIAFGDEERLMDPDRVLKIFLDNLHQSYVLEDGAVLDSSFTADHGEALKYISGLVDLEIDAKMKDAASTKVVIPTRRPKTNKVFPDVLNMGTDTIDWGSKNYNKSDVGSSKPDLYEDEDFEPTDWSSIFNETTSAPGDTKVAEPTEVKPPVVEPEPAVVDPKPSPKRHWDDSDVIDVDVIEDDLPESPHVALSSFSVPFEVGPAPTAIPLGPVKEPAKVESSSKPSTVDLANNKPVIPAPNGSTVTSGNTSVEIRANQILGSFDSQFSEKPQLEEASKVVRAELASILANVEPGYFVKNDLLTNGSLDVKKASLHFVGRAETNIDLKIEAGEDLGVNITDLAKALNHASSTGQGLGF